MELKMKEGLRRTKDRRFIVELRDRAMNRTFFIICENRK